MKKLIIAALILISGSAFAQTTYTFATYDPLMIIAPNNSQTHILQLATNGEKEVLVKFRAGNAGAVKVNTSSSTITSSPYLDANTDPNGIVVKSRAATGYKIYFRFETAGDTVVVTRWY